jgi:dihydropteroate synthase
LSVEIGGRRFDWGSRTYVMGIVNVTPDSFSDGGDFLNAEAAVAHALELVDEGADILDVGGESTRPGAEPVAAEEELRRIVPVLEGLVGAPGFAEREVQVSIDTSKAVVARAALARGASLVNDVTALRGDPDMAEVIARSGADCCLMHMLGEPRTMQADPRYEDVVGEVRQFLAERVAFAEAAGIARERIMVDPGIGFGKTEAHNLELIRRIGEVVSLGLPVAIGSSRKGFLGRILGRARGRGESVAACDRLAGTIVTNVLALARGASVFRVHDVGPVRDSLAVAAATLA